MALNITVQTNKKTSEGKKNTVKTKKDIISFAEDMYFVELRINGKKAYALVDTGSSMGIIPFYAAVSLGLIDQIDPRHRLTCYSIYGVEEFLGSIMQCKLEIKHFSFVCSFCVNKEADRPIIIGVDILYHFKAKLDISKCTLMLYIKDKPTTLPLFTLSELIDRNEPLIEPVRLYSRHYILKMKNTKNMLTIDDLTEKMKNFFHCKSLDKMYESALQRNPLILKGKPITYIEVNLNGYKVCAVLDTGSPRNIICEEFASEYKLKQFVDNNSPSTKIIVSDTASQSMLSQCDIGIGNYSFLEMLDVVPGLFPLILGTDFLRRIKANFDFEKKNVEFWKDHNKCTVPLVEKPF